jgi:hypothetical protein
MLEHEYDKLPDIVLVRIAALRDQERDVKQLMFSSQPELSAMQNMRDRLEEQRRSIHETIEKTHRDFKVPEYTDLVRRLTELAGRMTPLEERLEGFRARNSALALLNNRIAQYLASVPANAVLREADPVKVKRNKGETHLQAVERLRVQIASLINEQSRVQRSEPSAKEKKAKVASFVREELAKKGTPRLYVSHDRGVTIQFGRGVIGELDPTPLEVLSWIDPAVVIARLEAMIEVQPKHSNQMSAADRDQRLIEIKRELHEAERLEIQHIHAAMGEGQCIEHRANVSIPVLIGLTIGSKAKANAA